MILSLSHIQFLLKVCFVLNGCRGFNFLQASLKTKMWQSILNKHTNSLLTIPQYLSLTCKGIFWVSCTIESVLSAVLREIRSTKDLQYSSFCILIKKFGTHHTHSYKTSQNSLFLSSILENQRYYTPRCVDCVTHK